MARKKGLYGGFAVGIGKQQKPPAPRRYDYENMLCAAIKDRLIVEVQYDGDMYRRRYEPHIVYRSATAKILSYGIVLADANFGQELGPHNFEVGLIRDLRLTTDHFQPPPIFDRSRDAYKGGILCSI